MRMPRDVQVRRTEAPRVVTFRTADGRVEGTAFVERGCDETSYDVVGAELIPPSEARVRQVGDEVGAFELVGRVVEIWDEDGVCAVEALGFDVWVDPEELDGTATLGAWVRVLVAGFTLWV